MKYIADLHIHSRFSRATARNLNLPTLDYWAARKGIAVVGTGDLTHPGWLAEIEEQLVEAEEGLFRLKPEYALEGGGQTRFLLSGEISNIYKKNGKTRKVHNLVLLPDIEAARRFSKKLETIGNIHSDGRPILGLDSRNLLAISLDASPNAFFIPAHIWTPWFSLFGSNSGFDAIEECFDDLTPQIHALETGLSSDPAMNWRLSALDRYTLVSNSDAHSPSKLGRESNLFDTDLSYPAMVSAMKKQGGFGGTIEFFPEEGKYHLDGHRKCNLSLEPEETRRLSGICPVCGKPVTVGVYNRVLELADRANGFRPEKADPFYSLIPLTEVLGEILGVGPTSKKVNDVYETLLRKLGPELYILREVSLEDAAEAGGELFKTALERMRSGRVRAIGGYDGEYGTIGLFEPGELDRLAGQTDMFPGSAAHRPARPRKESVPKVSEPEPEYASPLDSYDGPPLLNFSDPLVDDLNPEQAEAVTQGRSPLCIIAGPGTGKTRVLTRRAAWLVREDLSTPERILCVTFTRQAAREMAERLTFELPFRAAMKRINVLTFHALGLQILTDHFGAAPKILDEDERLIAARKAAESAPFKASELLGLISLAKQKLEGPGDLDNPEAAAAFGRYETILAASGAVDFDDLVGKAALLLESQPDLLGRWQSRFDWLLIDEYQDVNYAQYRLVKLLAPGDFPNVTVIGDPDQAIYGFRGADSAFFMRFQADYPDAKIVRLSRNYRSTDTILRASSQVIANNPGLERPALVSGISGPARVTIADMATPAAEAEYVCREIERLIGGSSHFALDSGRADANSNGGRESGSSLGDVAILYRLHALAQPMAEALARAGLPFQQAGKTPVQETDELDFKTEKIKLLTMHAAKGLEFEIVFIIGLEKGLLPYHPPGKPKADEAEERRLFFVALTRARKHLYLLRSRTRTIYGQRRRPQASPFLAEIGKKLLQQDKLPDKPKKPKKIQMSLF